jgi:uncharacterized protein (DUF1810 family)
MPACTNGVPVSLQRFIDAQSPVIDAVMAELRAGEKRTHWMWFIFPQLKTLGRSSTARYYGIESVDEARAYLDQPVLGERLKACTGAVLTHRDKTANAIFGSPDDHCVLRGMTGASTMTRRKNRGAVRRFALEELVGLQSFGNILVLLPREALVS